MVKAKNVRHKTNLDGLFFVIKGSIIVNKVSKTFSFAFWYMQHQ